jgi:peptide deformylase
MRKIVLLGDLVLKAKAKEVIKIDASIRQLVSIMADAMMSAGGIGIAAPQVGESLQLAIVDVPREIGGIGRVVIINPRIISAYGSETAEEGCLSVPGVQVKVKRYKEISVEAMDLNGDKVTYKANGLFARAIQHEIDHLNGILITDNLTPIRRYFVNRKVLKIERGAKL